MKFYHSTSEERWRDILREGVLWGKRGKGTDRCTYLAIDIKDCPDNDVLLEVGYDPLANPTENNFNGDSWQFRVYGPIYKFCKREFHYKSSSPK